jgi:hypothetical protein
MYDLLGDKFPKTFYFFKIEKKSLKIATIAYNNMKWCLKIF